MPLPQDNRASWPPADVRPYTNQSRAWAAWWSGDTTQLAATADGGGTTGRRRFWQRTGGPSGWARAAGTAAPAKTTTGQVHAPLAADIAATSADLLFGEAPGLLLPGLRDARARLRDTDDETAPWGEALSPQETIQAQDRLDVLSETLGLPNTLLESAETAAGTGGVYLRQGWDEAVADHPLLDVIDPEHAVPDFTRGVLRAVTLWSTVHGDRAETWRHLERHEPGVILHGLYIGNATELGRRVPLAAHPATADLFDEDRRHAALDPRRMLVQYVPNVLPNRTLRGLPLGRSDYAGAEPFLDALDETWSSLIRDIRLGKGRVMAARELLQPVSAVPGAPKVFDFDDELFTPLEMADLSNVDPSKLLTPVQFAIRTREHLDTAVALTEQIVSSAGYSPQTFGLHIEGRAESGTALRLREAKTFRTQGRKQRYYAPAVARAAENLLYLDRVIFRRPTPVGRPEVQWQEMVDDPQGTASWVTLLRGAQAVSIETAVRLAQPHLDDPDVRAEADKIKAEQGMAVTDPLDDEDVP